MTIFAIVNNLIKGKQPSESPRSIWTLISSSGILQGGNPYFVPDFADCFEARLTLAARVGKLGKGVAPRFAERYVDAIAPCIVFVASDLLENLRRDGLPWTQAISYDKCTVLGKFVKIPYQEIEKSCIQLKLASTAGETLTEWNKKETYPPIEETISELSRDNTLKTGDIILLGLAGKGVPVAPGQRATLLLNGETSIGFNIR